MTKRSGTPIDDYAGFIVEFAEWCRKQNRNFKAEVMAAVTAHVARSRGPSTDCAELIWPLLRVPTERPDKRRRRTG
jgi:hypothetical protein